MNKTALLFTFILITLLYIYFIWLSNFFGKGGIILFSTLYGLVAFLLISALRYKK